MASMSGNSGDFKNPGAAVGIEVWRIEALHAVPVEKKFYGSFHTGDCYIVLNTFDDKYGKRAMDLYFWIGEKCSQDERGAVAYKAVELDDQLGGKPVQHREVQGHESAQMQSLFPGGIRYLEGGVASAFHHVDPSAYQPRLFHLKGKRNVRVQQVELKASSLNEGDVFILDAGLNLYQWNGKEANKFEKAKGLELITKINGDERGGKAKLHFLDSGKSDEESEFFKLLGGKVGVKGANEVPSDDEVKAAPSQLFNGDGQLLAQGPLDRAALSTDGTFLVDSGTELFVWIGKGAPADARRNAMSHAATFLQNNGRPDWTPITRVAEGGEQPAFKALFKVWEAPRVVDMKQPGAKKQAAADFSALYKAKQAAQEQLADPNGKIKIWRIENFAKVELDPSFYGEFYGGDSYIVLYQFKVKGRDSAIIYFWQGRQSSQDEKGASALLAKELWEELGRQATQVRVVQNKEPDQFLNLFKGKMIVLEGGKAGSFKNRHEVDSYHSNQTGLFHVRGTTAINTRAVQVDATASSLNSGDCFVLNTPAVVFAWNGSGSSDSEHKVALAVAERLAAGRTVTSVAEGSESDAFWEALGGKADYPTSKALESGEHDARLFQCSNSGAGFKISEVFNFSQDDLVNDDVMMLDAYSEVYVWLGHDSNQQEKELSLQAALDYVKNAPDGRDADTPVFLVEAGQEPPSFTCHFLGWDHNKAHDFSDPYAKKLAGLKGAAVEHKVAAPSPAPAARLVTGAADAGLSFADPSKSTFSLAQIKAGQAGVDPKVKEQYLHDAEFNTLFGMDKASFNAMPAWKKEQAKKKHGLF